MQVPKVMRSRKALFDDDITSVADNTTTTTRWVVPNQHEGNGNDQQLIVHEPITKTWCPPRDGKFVKQVFIVQLIRDIETVTGCRVELSETSSQLTIRGDIEENVDRAIKKLKAIDKSHVSTLPTDAYRIRNSP